jgi:hypothetical protein
MTERREESEEISRAARRMAEAAEEMSRSVARLAEHEAATEQAYRFWENFARTLEEVRSTGSWGPWRIVPFQPTLSEEDAVLLAVQSVREVREELWGEREAEITVPDQEDIERWVRKRADRRESEGYRLP